MKSETVAYFAKSREFLNKARELFDAHHWPDEAGRAAYLAGLHAAQALIFERTGKVIKRHHGVQRELARLVEDEPRFDMELRAQLVIQQLERMRGELSEYADGVRGRVRLFANTTATAEFLPAS
jgi:uncharacterized protein (UPF0332 family)